MGAQVNIADAELLEAERLTPALDAFGKTAQFGSGWRWGLGVQGYNFDMDETGPISSTERLYTADQVRLLDSIAIKEAGIAGSELMERAGRAAFEHALERFPGKQKWLVLCGGGNNGGDGYVIARLAREAGIECQLFALKSTELLEGDAATAAQGWLESGGQVCLGPPTDAGGFDLVVDALLGTGLDRPPQGEYAEAIDTIEKSDAVVLAVDIPSGLNADTGCAMGGIAVSADLTVTFVGRKRGLYTADGPDYSGQVRYESLGVPPAVFESIDNSGLLIQENLIGQLLHPRCRNSHKGSFGWVLGVGGDRGMSGALRLCGAAALRTGAGKVTLATHQDHATVLNLDFPELMVMATESVEDLDVLLNRANVVVLGTGLGQSEWSRRMLQVFGQFAGPMVVDADALNLIAAGDMFDVLDDSRRPMILTPHPAEAARLLRIETREVQCDRVVAALKLADQSGAVVVLKGCGTVVANPGGPYAICPLGNPGMASAGTGDVLAGIVGAMLAQGLGAWEAATAGVVAHAVAGDRAAYDVGERGMIASDIIRALPAVLNPV